MKWLLANGQYIMKPMSKFFEAPPPKKKKYIYFHSIRFSLHQWNHHDLENVDRYPYFMIADVPGIEQGWVTFFPQIFILFLFIYLFIWGRVGWGRVKVKWHCVTLKFWIGLPYFHHQQVNITCKYMPVCWHIGICLTK